MTPNSSSGDVSYSIVVPVYNMAQTIERTLTSILNQRFPGSVQLIVVDGASSDGTLSILERYCKQIDVLISEKDEGLYDAINKGLRHATGNVIAILNADDYYADSSILEENAQTFSTGFRGILFGDVEFFREARPGTTVRRYSSSSWTPSKLKSGWMPPHPTVFAHRDVYAKVGDYRTDYKIAADYEFLIRALLITGIPYRRIDRVLVRMQLGGLSTSGISAALVVTREIVRACRENCVATSYLRVLGRLPMKLGQFFVAGSDRIDSPRPR